MSLAPQRRDAAEILRSTLRCISEREVHQLSNCAGVPREALRAFVDYRGSPSLHELRLIAHCLYGRDRSFVSGLAQMRTERRKLGTGQALRSMGGMGDGRPYGASRARLYATDRTAAKIDRGVLGAEVKKMSTRVTISFDAAADATDAHRVLVGLRDSYTPPRWAGRSPAQSR